MRDIDAKRWKFVQAVKARTLSGQLRWERGLDDDTCRATVGGRRVLLMLITGPSGRYVLSVSDERDRIVDEITDQEVTEWLGAGDDSGRGYLDELLSAARSSTLQAEAAYDEMLEDLGVRPN